MSVIEPVRLLVTRREPVGSRKLLASNAADRGVLVFSATPRNEGPAPVTRGLLEAMGKDPRLTDGATCSTRYGWPLLAPWLLGLDVAEIVVDEAQLLPPAVLQELIVLAAGLGIRLWLVAHRPLGEDYPAVLAAWPTVEATEEALAVALAAPRRVPEPPEVEEARRVIPVVPDSEFLFFRADCRDLLEPGQFAEVDQRYLKAAEDARTWFYGADGPVHAEDVARMLRAVLPECSGPDEMLTVIRASAAVLLLAGVLVTCDAAGLRATVVDQDWYLARRHPDWSALGGYRQPYRAAVCATTAAGFSLDRTAGLVCSEVACDGSWVGSGGSRVAIAPAGRSFLRCQLLARKESGAGPEDPLFVTAEGAPASVRYLREALTEPTVEAGVELATGRVSRRPPTPGQWAARLGIRIRRVV